MSTAESGKYALLDQLAEEFAERFRQGERPSLQEYLDRYPDLADDIRELFPAMVEIEQVDGERREVSEPAAAAPRLEQLGDFRIIRKVGHGGMGVVYEAEQLSLGRHVALKVLPQKMLLDPKYKRRFEREAKAAAKLHHTHIVPVFGVGEHEGMPYYAMQFIQGLGLDEVLDELRQMQAGAGTPGSAPAAGALPVARKDVSAAEVARSLLTGEFQGARPATEEDAGGEPVLVTTVDEPHSPSGDSSSPGSAPTARLVDSLTSSSIVLPGQSETSRKKAKKQTYWQSVAHLGVQVADALDYAHKQGVLHRDIKPSNLLLDLGGTVWVTDFGLAKADDHQNLTHTGDIIGTLRYMPPEAFEARADARGDIYSLGLTLYELLALRPAYEEKDRAQLIKRVTSEEPPRLEKLNPTIPRDLVTIVHKATDRDPGHRYQAASELAADLQRFLDDEPIQARPISTVERAWRWCKRNPTVASLTAAVVVLLLALAIGGIAAAVHFGTRAEQERRLKADADRARQEAENQAEISRQRLVRLNVEKGTRLQGDGDVPGALVWFTEALRLDQGDAAREELHRLRIGAAWRQCPKPVHVWFHGEAQHAEFSPDGRRILTFGAGLRELGRGEAIPTAARAVQVWDTATGQPVTPPLAHGDLIGKALFCADGQCVLTVSFTRVESADGRPRYARPAVLVWDLATGKPRQAAVRLPEGSLVVEAAVNPAGSRCLLVVTRSQETDPSTLLAGGEDELVLVDLLQGKPLWQRAVRTQRAKPVFSPDGQRILLAAEDLQILDADTGQSLVALKPALAGFRSEMIIAARFSPDGSRVVLTSQKAALWNAATGDPSPFLLEHPNITVKDAVFSPDGKRVLTSGWYALRVWDVDSGRPVTDYLRHGGDVAFAQFTPDGRQVVAAGSDGIVRLWDAENGVPATTPLYHGARVLAVQVSPDGRQLTTASADGSVRLWDLATSIPPFRSGLGTDESWTRNFSFSPDGRYLATGSSARAARVWESATGQPVTPELRHDGVVLDTTFSPDGRQLTTLCADRRARVWDVATGRLLFATAAHPYPLDRVAYSPDGKLLVTISAQGNSRQALPGEVRVWDAATGKPSTPALTHSGRTITAAFVDGGRRLLTVDRNEARGWDPVTGEVLSRARSPMTLFNAAAISPDGTRVAVAFYGRATVWEAATGQVLAQMRLGGEVFALAFSPDGRQILSATGEGVAQVWNAATGEPVGPPLKHTGAMYHAAFSPDGRRIVTAGSDRTVRVWEVTTSIPFTPPLKQPSSVGFAVFSPDGARLATRSAVRSQRGQVSVWDLPADDRPVEDLVALATFLAARRINPTDNFVSLRAEELQAAWTAVLAKHAGDFRATRQQQLAWHRDEAADCERQGNYETVIRHLTQVLELDPEQPRLFARRGHAHAELRHWDQATGDYAKVAGQMAEDRNVEWGYNLLSIRRGERVAYRQLCAKILDQHAGTKNFSTANHAAWMCVLAPDAVDNFKPVVKLGEVAVAGAPASVRWTYLNTLGAALCRNGQYPEAIAKLHEGMRQRGNEGSPWDWLFLALAQHHLGQKDEAQRWLDRSIPWIDEALQKPPLGTTAAAQGTASRYGAKLLTWTERLELELLRQEVQKHLGSGGF